MNGIVLSSKRYRDKVLGCWLGKNIGGTLGSPYEGIKRAQSLTFYDPVPDKPLPNDDLDLQIVWLRMLEDLDGRLPTLSDFADAWLTYLRAWPPDEYGFCLHNLERGLRPPISGLFENRDIDCMGAPIRSEIWACLAPGDPQLAAAMASRDAVLDHAGGEGLYGEMFWAAAESAAFVIEDPLTLIRIGLDMIPLHSHIARAIRDVVWCFENGKSKLESYDRIVGNFAARHRGVGYAHPCFAVPNHAFTIIGWLYGKGFGGKLCTAVNCGFDTDCTGATLGSMLGILGGARRIPDKWIKPIGQTIVMDRRTGECGAPRDVRELTRRTVRLARKIVPRHSDVVRFGATGRKGADVLSSLFRNERAAEALRECDFESAVARSGDLEIVLHYHGEPVVRPGVTKRVDVSARRDNVPCPVASAQLKAPRGWQVRAAGDRTFELGAGSPRGRNTLCVTAECRGKPHKAEFTILGPSEARGHNLYWGVPVCKVCRCRVEACMCPPA